MQTKLIVSCFVLTAIALGVGYIGWLWFGDSEPIVEAWNMPIQCTRSEGGDSAVMDQSVAAEMFSWRCRQNATALSGRAITEAEVSSLDAKLSSFWSTQTAEPHAKPLSHYVRQYASVAVDGKEKICVNLISRDFVEINAYYNRHDRTMRSQLPKGVCPEDAWRHNPIVGVADGGVNFCGVTFDITTGKFSDVNCNGM